MNDNLDDRHHDELSVEAEYFSKIMSSAEFVSDISKLIACEKSDYVYFNSQMLKKNWNLKHWHPFKTKSTRSDSSSKFFQILFII